MNLRTKDLELVTGPPLSATALDALRRTFRGECVTPTDSQYDRVRRVRNAMLDRRPALIARCLGAADVVAALRFAACEGFEIAVRGGGHSIVGHSMADGAVVIDLSLMRGVHVDPARRLATAQGGALIADLDRESQHAGLATTGGLVATTGLGGLAVGGGYGWLARRFGLACDNLRAAEVVTADGSIRDASESEHADLFWALRGGGGNFGVVTRFELALHPFGPQVMSGDAFYRVDDGMAALRAFRDVLGEAPPELYLMAAVLVANEQTPVPDDQRGRPVVMITWAWVGDRPRDGERAARALHRAGRPVAQYVNELTYVDLQSGPHGLDAPPRRMYWKSSFLDEVPDAVLEAFLGTTVEAAGARGLAGAELISMGGAIGRVGEDATAYRHRGAAVDFLAVASWDDAHEDDARMAAARAIWEGVAGGTGAGVYVNNLGSEGDDRVREAYGDATYRRLAAIKARYDPGNVFRHTANIRPAT